MLAFDVKPWTTKAICFSFSLQQNQVVQIKTDLLQDVNADVKKLKLTIQQLTSENQRLKEENESLRQENESLRQENESPRQRPL